MRAMVLEQPRLPLRNAVLPDPVPLANQLLVRIAACGVCRTDLHVVDGELTQPKLPSVPGHEIVGRVEDLGADVTDFHVGERVGIPWLGHTCGQCRYCRMGTENLCDAPGFTGYQINGGYAELTVADAAYCFHLPESYDDVSAAPLLCAGLIGYRALRMAEDARHLGIYGFGAAAHIVAQIAHFQGRSVYAFTRPGDQTAQAFALHHGCVWAGGSDQAPQVQLDAAIIFAPVGSLVPAALAGCARVALWCLAAST
jgi:propanol-preferring alcohol dehydrogenase